MHPPTEELFAYRDGELGPEKRGVIEAHVTSCSVCRALIDQVSALEAELRQSPDSAPEGYLDRLGESVRARIAVTASAAGAGDVLAAPAPVSDRGKSPRPAGRVREERGRADQDAEDRDAERERGRVKEAPKLPWAAVVGTMSAAAAVLVVVVILIRQGPYQRMITPRPEPRTVQMETREEKQVDEGVREGGNGGEAQPQPQGQVPVPPSSSTAPAPQKGEAVPSPSIAAPPDLSREVDGDAKIKVGYKDQLLKKSDEIAMNGSVPAPAGGARSDDVGALQSAPEEERDARARAKTEAAAPRAMSQKVMATEAGYRAILDRFGLPALWDSRVRPEALANAEPELRSFYMSGAAGADSARVRLYLAEAARLRYGPGDPELHDEIQHHYQRVIELAGPDAEVARVARERLRSLER